jgi:hypothetical protein
MLSIDFGRAAADFFGHGFDPSGLGVVDINQGTKGNGGDPDPPSHSQKLYSKTGFPVASWVVAGKLRTLGRWQPHCAKAPAFAPTAPRAFDGKWMDPSKAI